MTMTAKGYLPCAYVSPITERAENRSEKNSRAGEKKKAPSKQ